MAQGLRVCGVPAGHEFGLTPTLGESQSPVTPVPWATTFSAPLQAHPCTQHTLTQTSSQGTQLKNQNQIVS